MAIVVNPQQEGQIKAMLDRRHDGELDYFQSIQFDDAGDIVGVGLSYHEADYYWLAFKISDDEIAFNYLPPGVETVEPAALPWGLDDWSDWTIEDDPEPEVEAPEFSGFSFVPYLPDAEVDFAAKGTKKTGRKNCTTGWPCKSACIARTKNCRKVLDGEAATYADWLSSQVKAKGMDSLSAKHQAEAANRGLGKERTTDGLIAQPQSYQDFIENGRVIAGDFPDAAKELNARFEDLANRRNKFLADNSDQLAQDLAAFRLKDKQYSALVERNLELDEIESRDLDALIAKKITGLEFQRRQDNRQLERGDLEDERKKLIDRLDAEFTAKHPVLGAMAKEETALGAVAQRFKDDLIASSSLSQEQAMRLAEKTRLPRMSREEDSQIRQDIAQVYRLTNGQGSDSLKRVEFSNDRAYADEGIITVRKGSPDDLMHEMAHHVEFEDPIALSAAKSWVLSRATGKPEKLSVLNNDDRYGDNEIAYPDRFVMNYVGRVYEYDATEVLSVGFEYFVSPRYLTKLVARDPDHFAFVLGVLRNPARSKKRV